MVAGWNIYKDVLKRDRVKVTGGFRIMLSDETDRQDVFVVSVTNLSDRPLSVTHVGGFKYHRFRWPLLAKLLPKAPDPGAYLLSFNPLYSPLPRRIEARHSESIVYTIAREDFPPVVQLWVTTSDGRNWYAPRRDVRAIAAERAEAQVSASEIA